MHVCREMAIVLALSDYRPKKEIYLDLYSKIHTEQADFILLKTAFHFKLEISSGTKVSHRKRSQA